MLFYTTPVPNAVIRLIPTLNGGETKVILIVVQKTLGWKDETTMSKRKERDWISISQFETESGMSRRTIGFAIDSLVEKGHIIVTDHAGNVVNTPEKRKGCSRLYFQLSPALMPPSEDYNTYLRRKSAELANKFRYTK